MQCTQKKTLEDAKNVIVEQGYSESLERRYASVDDISINNILFADRSTMNRMEKKDIFAEMSDAIPVNPKNLSRVEEVSIEDFIKTILPAASSLELLFENKHMKNLVSLIAPQNSDAKSMFKWDNPFGWAYTGNITDSSMKENVKKAGGNVDGVLRFSIQWNELGVWNNNDLDAYCIEPGGFCIYYSNKKDYTTGGTLDVDIQRPEKDVPAVENITWTDKKKMKPGVYKFYVNNFNQRNGSDGFRAEIEFDGVIYNFDFPRTIRQSENIQVAEVTLDKNGNFSIKEMMPGSKNISSKDIWGINTNQFVPVSVVCLSPNYWNEQHGIGNKHFMFMLKGCVNSESPNGFYNEFLKEDLTKYGSVLEALGMKMKVDDEKDQLSGIGFSSTRRNDVIVKVKGQSERLVKIIF